MLSVSKERNGTTRVALLEDGSEREGAALTPGQSSGMRRGPGLFTALVNAALQRPPPGTAPRRASARTSSSQRGFQPFSAEPSIVRELWFHLTLNSPDLGSVPNV